MSQVSVQEGKTEVQEPKTKTKAPKEAKTKITDQLVERAFNTRADSSEIKALIERMSKGPVLTRENKAIEIVQHNTGALNRIIKELGFKGKVKAKSTEKGKALPSMIWRVS